MPKVSLDIDRKTASKILGVSIRTIDRHIRDGKFLARRENGRIWLDKKEIKRSRHNDESVQRQSIDRPYGLYNPAQQKKEANADFYKDLYNEAKAALAEYRQKLDQANYRIGQLESQVLHSASQKGMDRHDDFSSEMLRKDLMDRERELILLRELVKREKLNRVIFSVIAYLLLIALPVLWFLLR